MPEIDNPFATLSSFSSGIDRNDPKVLVATGSPLGAFKHLFACRDFRARELVASGSPVDDDGRERWSARLSSGSRSTRSKDFGSLPIMACRSWNNASRADRLEDAITAAERLGFPVALKTAAPSVHHKSDGGGLEIRPLLDGGRGQPPADRRALVSAIVALSWLARDLGDYLQAPDTNPVICGQNGCLAVDALVIPRSP